MDWLGAISGIVAGQAFSPLDKKAQYQYLYQGANKGVSHPWGVGYLGVSSAIGTVSLGYPKGIQAALKDDAGMVGVLRESAKPYAKVGEATREGAQNTFDVLAFLSKYGIYIALGVGAILLYGMVKK